MKFRGFKIFKIFVIFCENNTTDQFTQLIWQLIIIYHFYQSKIDLEWINELKQFIVEKMELMIKHKRIWPFLERPSTLSGVKNKDHDEHTEIKFDDNKTNKNSYNLDKEGGKLLKIRRLFVNMPF